MLLNIDLPKFDFPVIFDEHVWKKPEAAAVDLSCVLYPNQ